MEKKTSNGIRHFCDSCWEYRKILTKATHIQEPDPYAEEINSDETPVDLCEHCYHESCMDI